MNITVNITVSDGLHHTMTLLVSTFVHHRGPSRHGEINRKMSVFTASHGTQHNLPQYTCPIT
jgi:hypothetical protein